MNVFFHIRDHGRVDYSTLPVLLLLSRPLTVWSPPYNQLLKLYSEDQFPFSPDQFLELVKGGVIKIAGRREWFDRNLRGKQDHWLPYHWHDPFDGIISSIEQEDSCKSFEKRRVFSIDPGITFDEVHHIIKQGGPHIELARKISRKFVRQEAGGAVPDLPEGMVMRLRSLQGGRITEQSVLPEVVRDSVNYVRAVSSMKCDLSFHDKSFPVASFYTIGGARWASTDHPIVRKNIDDLMSLVCKINEAGRGIGERLFDIENVEDIIRFSKDDRIADEVDVLMRSTVDVTTAVCTSIITGDRKLKVPFLNEVFGSDFAHIAGQVGGLALSTLPIYSVVKDFKKNRPKTFGEALTRRSLLSCSIGVGAAMLLETEAAVLEDAGVISEPSFQGPLFPAMIGFGTTKLTRAQISKLDWWASDILKNHNHNLDEENFTAAP
jgi:hypothetical protein